MHHRINTKQEALAEWLMLEYDIECINNPNRNISEIDWSMCDSKTDYENMLKYICKLYNIKNDNTIVSLSQLKYNWNEYQLKDVEFKVTNTTVYGYPGYSGIRIERKRSLSDEKLDSDSGHRIKRQKNKIRDLTRVFENCKISQNEFNWIMSLEMDKKRVSSLFPGIEPFKSKDPDVKEEWQFRYDNIQCSIYQLKNQPIEWDLAVESGADSDTIKDLVDDLEFYFDVYCKM